MRYFEKDNIYVLIIDRGEELVSTISNFCKKNKIKAAFVSGIGALSNINLGYFDIIKKEYIKREFDNSYELININGNISVKEDNYILHCHVVLGGPDYSLKGGHLFRGLVSVTAEIYILPLDGKLIREMDEETSLNLIRKSE
jgi:predicted DNA-binding protein with PD1-like motif